MRTRVPSASLGTNRPRYRPGCCGTLALPRIDTYIRATLSHLHQWALTEHHGPIVESLLEHAGVKSAHVNNISLLWLSLALHAAIAFAAAPSFAFLLGIHWLVPSFILARHQWHCRTCTSPLRVGEGGIWASRVPSRFGLGGSAVLGGDCFPRPPKHSASDL